MLGLKEKDKEKEILRREKVNRQEVEMLEGTFRVFLVCSFLSRSGTCMYVSGGLRISSVARRSRELRGQMESSGMVQRLLSTRWSRDVPRGQWGMGDLDWPLCLRSIVPAAGRESGVGGEEGNRKIESAILKSVIW